jgi:hypothetical protein
LPRVPTGFGAFPRLGRARLPPPYVENPVESPILRLSFVESPILLPVSESRLHWRMTSRLSCWYVRPWSDNRHSNCRTSSSICGSYRGSNGINVTSPNSASPPAASRPTNGPSRRGNRWSAECPPRGVDRDASGRRTTHLGQFRSWQRPDTRGTSTTRASPETPSVAERHLPMPCPRR